MDVQHIGHAGLIVGAGGFRLGIDPWFYPAFLESWFPWPDNRHFLGEALSVDALCISHAHEDHFDRRFLRQVPDKGIPVIVPAFRQSRHLEREVRGLGFTRVIALAHGERFRPGRDLTVTMLIDQSHKEDAAILVEDAAGFRLLDSNDCELAISDWPTGIDLLACQFSGAFWYPHCYDFPDEVKAAKAAGVRAGNLARLARRAGRTGARSYLPSAGPAVFLDEALEHYNYGDGIYPTFDQVLPAFRDACPGVALWPSLRLGVRPDALRAYAARRSSEWQAFYDRDDGPATTAEVEAHFTRLQRRNRRFLDGYRAQVRVSCDGRAWRVPLGLVAGELEEAPEPHYALDVPPIVMRAVLDGQATWETALLSNRVRLHRDPDAYDTTLMGLLGFGDRPVQTLAMARQREAAGEVVTRGGITFQRWCPHAREDLGYAAVGGGVITCPRHGWRWDAVTGECLSGGGLPLHVGGVP